MKLIIRGIIGFSIIVSSLSCLGQDTDGSAYITTWKTDNPGTSDNNQAIISVSLDYTYNYDIYWYEVDDPTNNGSITGLTTGYEITFPHAGIYAVEISGTFPAIVTSFFFGDRDKILSVEQWGTGEWLSMEKAFEFSKNLQVNATDAPNLSNTSSLAEMFKGASVLNADLNHWDVSNVTDMRSMFRFARDFNGDISSWNVSNVIDMSGMFDDAESFNGDLSAWNVSAVEDMGSMFNGASSFNGDISSWNVSNVQKMGYMFAGTRLFNSNIGSWDMSGVSDVFYMFDNALAFNADISGWNLSSVTDATGLFKGASSFNQNIGSWNVSGFTNLSSMFQGASVFNQDLSSWDVSGVTNMSSMFAGAIAFNQDISGWNVGNVTNMNSMFNITFAFNQDINAWNVSNVTEMSGMFQNALVFNQNLEDWDVSNVTDMTRMFFGATAFNQNLGGWDVGNVQNMRSMLDRTNISKSNYESLLIGWSSLTLQSGVLFGAGDLYYCNGDTERQHIIDTYNWTISDARQQCDRTELLSMTFNEQIEDPQIGDFGASAEFVVLAGTDITAIAPVEIVVSEGATITPGVNEVQDFTNPVIYTITAEDGVTTEEWEIAFRDAYDEKDILAVFDRFFVREIDPVNATVTLLKPYDSDLSSQSPEFSLSREASIFPANESTQDFTSPVVYTVTAEDGSTKDWTVSMELHQPSTTPFITTWQVDESSSNVVGLRSSITFGLNYTVDWGDGQVQENIEDFTVGHAYDEPGIYTVSIVGHYPTLEWSSANLLSVEQWGDTQWTSMHEAFEGCTNLTINANDAPDFTHVTSMYGMFNGCTNLSGNFDHWDVSNITSMSSLFAGAMTFNEDISSWNVGNVQRMRGMFGRAESFNGDISGWDVSNVEDMSYMFSRATSFDQDLGTWNTSKVQDLEYAFSEAASFNGDLSGWDVGNVTIMRGMFSEAISFNQDISAWDVSNVISMEEMFSGASAYNQELDTWDVSSVIRMDEMFDNAISFDRSLAAWDVSNVLEMRNMLTNTNLSLPTYDTLLISWSKLDLKQDVHFGIHQSYCAASDERQSIIESYGWTINDRGVNCDFEANIISFFVEGQFKASSISLSNKEVLVQIEEGFDLTQVAPSFELSEYATATPDSGQVVDFSNPVIYTVTSYAEVETQDWLVTLGLPLAIESEQLKVYPNPVTSNIRIETEQRQFDYISVVDLLGNEVIPERIFTDQNERLDVSALSQGIYLLVLRKDSERLFHKFIKK